MHLRSSSLILTSLLLAFTAHAQWGQYVDPRIGSEGEGRVVIGPSCPFGMVKPSPDCTVSPNSGWLPMPTQVNGFSQTHVSGTGGGPKYGNILVQPFIGETTGRSHPQQRTSEEMHLGYYHCQYESGIDIELTTAQRASLYRVTYPADAKRNLLVDAGWFLGEQPVPDARETQQFVGSEMEIRSSREVSGYTRIRGGWNNGRAYTVFFWLLADHDFEPCTVQYTQGRAYAPLHFVGRGAEPVHFKVGISFISERQARQNALSQIQDFAFDATLQACVDQWEQLLGRIEIDPSTPDEQKRMFYTGLYHTLLEPVDRTGENPLWTDYQDHDPSKGLIPYYDDFYAIWDTYRTSSPLITLMDPLRQADIVRSLINIGKRDGYMPDARSGNCNGRTQGGSNAEIVLADAFVKGLGTEAHPIDWNEALTQMLKDATLPPGGNQEAEGRGGLTEYLQLGYVPYGIDRSGNRTMEYAFCDYAISVVAQGLGRQNLAGQYLQQAGNWKNLWRPDYEHDGTRGFILPRDAEGHWLDTLRMGHSHNLEPTFVYTPVTNESPWYKAWWGTVFYEATSWEYSLSVPHDVPGLIDICGGAQAFERRLDTFFDRGYYNVNNEPSFLTPCLYHWLGRPDRTSDRVREIISHHFNAGSVGLPGNDDSGSMSSWLVFHMMGLYPNAGTNYYLIHTPLLRSTTLHLANGRDFTITAPKLSDRNRYIVGARLNGQDYPLSYLLHQQLMAGGTLELIMGSKPGSWGREAPVGTIPSLAASSPHAARQLALSHPISASDTLTVDFDLRTQHRIFRIYFEPDDQGILLHWELPRGGSVHRGSYRMSHEALASARQLCYIMPQDGYDVTCPEGQLFCFLSSSALDELVTSGTCRFNHTTLTLIGDPQAPVLHARDTDEGYDLWINNHPSLPFIVSMKGNPVEVDWSMRQ